MGCNCGKSIPQGYNSQKAYSSNTPTITKGTNNVLIKQMEEMQRQQQEIQRIINPSKTLIKIYR